MGVDTAQGWESGLDSVVVYASGALCRRRARGTVPPDGRVRLTGLPRALDPGSLRARVLGGGARVTEARVEIAAELRGTEQLSELHREVERAREVQDAARERHARGLSRIEEIASLHAVPPARKREDPHRRTPADAWLELAEFVDERLNSLHTEAGELEEAVRQAEHALRLAEDRLARASSAEPSGPVATSATALLTVSGEGEIDLELEYGVPGARWVPTYQLTHHQDQGAGRLTLRASIAQRTGEDWTGVRLGLSTADLQRRTDLPRLRSLRIGRSQPSPAPAGWREPPAGLNGLFAGYDDAGPRPYAAPIAVASAATAPPAPAAYGAGMPYAASPQPQAPMAARVRLAGPAGAPPPAPGAPPTGAGASAAAPAPPPPPAGPPRPTAALLDYAALALAGPEEPAARRGRLLPATPADPVALEYRRRAESVAALPLPGHAVLPRESAGSFDHRFDAAAPADIPSDGTWHTVAVAEIPVSLRTEYVTVPAVEEAVYATLVLANATDQALLAGPVDVTVDGDFLLTTALPTLAPGAIRRVGLGQAEGVRVARHAVQRESTAGMLNNTTVLDHRIQVELANRLTHSVTVEVRERVPVSSDPDIRIEERADWTATDEASPDHLPSTRRWRVELPAGGTAELHGGYEIRLPAGKALVGGNRRS